MAAQGPFLSVLTFNVRFDQHDPDRVLQAVLQANADVVAIQELTTELDRFLTDKLSTEYRTGSRVRQIGRGEVELQPVSSHRDRRSCLVWRSPRYLGRLCDLERPARSFPEFPSCSA